MPMTTKGWRWTMGGASAVALAILFANEGCNTIGSASVASVEGSSYASHTMSDALAPWTLIVVDEQGRPVEGATVAVSFNMSGSFAPFPRTLGQTDRKGRFDIPSYQPLLEPRRERLFVAHASGGAELAFPWRWPAKVVLSPRMSGMPPEMPVLNLDPQEQAGQAKWFRLSDQGDDFIILDGNVPQQGTLNAPSGNIIGPTIPLPSKPTP